MEDLLAQEQAAEEHVRGLLRSGQLEFVELPGIFKAYRSLCLESIFADFYNVELREQRLWDLHQLGRKTLHQALQRFRQEPNRVVERRDLIKLYIRFLKDSEKFYRHYIYRLNIACGGIPELQQVALAQKQNGEGESQQPLLPTDLQRIALESCHRSLIYLGDLSRYRATEKLDNEPDFGPALGYYGLAADIKPASGQGNHQQAVIALDQKDYLRVLYCLYRSMCVPEPHVQAQKNLEVAIAKINSSWAKGDLIQKSRPNDQGEAQRALEGWFVRLHALCYKGDAFRGYDELEAEVLNRLLTCVKSNRPLDHMLMRMILTNIGAAELAGQRFQMTPDDPSQSSFMHYFCFAMKTFTAFLQLFSEDIRATLLRADDPEVEPAALLTQTVRRLLPCLRVYTNWLVQNLRMVLGISSDPFAAGPVWHFWAAYAQALDLINQAFSIWDLDDGAGVEYMLEEDVNTLQFLPITGDATIDTWYTGFSGALKPSYTDVNVVRRAADEEMLYRIRDFLNKGSTIAFHESAAPINLRGTRIFFGGEENIEPPVLRPIEPKPAMGNPPSVQEKPKPVSYAAAAANGHARKARPQPAMGAGSAKGQSRDDQLSRMVDDLVEDDDGNNPITPPQQVISNPAIVTNGEAPSYALQDSVQDLGNGQKKSRHANDPSAKPIGTGRGTAAAQNAKPGQNQKATHGHQDRMQSVSKLWDNSSMFSPPFPSGLPTGTLASPPGRPQTHGHSRVNSASSIRSRNSLNIMDTRGSVDSAPRTLPDNVVPATSYGNYSSLDQTGMTSPFLFGAGDSVWSPGVSHGFRNTSPPNGRGG